jgi:HPt (histidine-containing phosphotransfer) domain-containing protein
MLHEDNEIIHYPSALERIGGDKEFLEELLDIYMEEFESQVSVLDSALESQDFRAIQEIGHSLKGASANLSLMRLGEQAFRIETAGREGDIESARRGTDAMKVEFQNLKDHLAGA